MLMSLSLTFTIILLQELTQELKTLLTELTEKLRKTNPERVKVSFCTIVLKEILAPNKYVVARILFELTIDNNSLIPMYLQ